MARRYMGAVSTAQRPDEVINIEITAKRERDAKSKIEHLANELYPNSNLTFLGVSRINKQDKLVNDIPLGNTVVLGDSLAEDEPIQQAQTNVKQLPTPKAKGRTTGAVYSNALMAKPEEALPDEVRAMLCDYDGIYTYDLGSYRKR